MTISRRHFLASAIAVPLAIETRETVRAETEIAEFRQLWEMQAASPVSMEAFPPRPGALALTLQGSPLSEMRILDSNSGDLLWSAGNLLFWPFIHPISGGRALFGRYELDTPM